MTDRCKHPQVRVVSRTEDAEFVECQQCREVFDSAEFDDMVIEEASVDDLLQDDLPTDDLSPEDDAPASAAKT